MACRCEDRSASCHHRATCTVHGAVPVTCIVPGLDGDVVLGPWCQGHLRGERGTNRQQVRALQNCPLNRASKACANLVKQDDPRAASQPLLGLHSPAAHSCPQLVSVRSPRLFLATAHTL